jgi:hypothetical protein
MSAASGGSKLGSVAASGPAETLSPFPLSHALVRVGDDVRTQDGVGGEAGLHLLNPA